jgi:hypothetical protein
MGEGMLRLWVREFKNNHLLKDLTLEDDSEDTRTHRIMKMLEEACYQFDLPKPLWLEVNVKDFQNHARCRFTQDSFVEEVDFDYMEIRVLEEDGS